MITCVDVFDQAAKTIGGSQQNVDIERIGYQLVFTYLIQHAFEAVRQLIDTSQFQKAGGAFDRMNRAENRVDQVVVDVRPHRFDGQELGFDIGQVFAGLLNKFRNDFLVDHGLAMGWGASTRELKRKSWLDRQVYLTVRSSPSVISPRV